MRKRNLAVIYSFVDYVTEREYDPSEVAFLTHGAAPEQAHLPRCGCLC